VLVECCVSLVLLAAGSALVLLVTANTAHFVDASRQHDLLQRVTASALAPVLASPCHGAAPATPLAVTPRMRLDVVTTTAGSVRTVVVDAQWQSSMFADDVRRRYSTAVSGWCE
jgi:hypothetical protein